MAAPKASSLKPARPKKAASKKVGVRKPAAKKPQVASASPVHTGIARLGLIIAHAKRDLAALQAQEIGRTHLPTAGDELSAIVGATEAATNAILDAVERIEKTANTMPGDAAAAITQDVTAIYEACNFQDITGQRISKVVSVLKEVDATVAELLATLDLPKVDLSQAPALASKPQRTGDEALLNGPQSPGGAPNQADIDALFDKA
ncbi:MAG: protein phosphatase CheZ [Telmatospirillum sp.]|nr:protein phosphatase CheZ [Telmatospirillum sp.]